MASHAQKEIQNIEVSKTMPDGFACRVHVAACYVEYKGCYLLLQRPETVSEGLTWTIPGGKVEAGETTHQAVSRELFEETGIKIDELKAFEPRGSFFIRRDDFDFIYHMFHLSLSSLPKVYISKEHRAYDWVGLNAIDSLPLMQGAKELLEHYKNKQNEKMSTRKGAFVCVYLILRKDADVLMHLRNNTGYADGFYGLVSGHVEDGESATEAMCREALEEAGITIRAEDLTCVHVMHRNSDRYNIDIFFECSSWEGEIVNQEPEKCSALCYQTTNDLPSNTIPYIKEALEMTFKGIIFSEYGWN